MQLVGPVLVVLVLLAQMLDLLRGQGHLAAVLAHGASQNAHGVVLLAPRRIVPALDGCHGETGLGSAHRMRPGLGGKGVESGLELSLPGGRA